VSEFELGKTGERTLPVAAGRDSSPSPSPASSGGGLLRRIARRQDAKITRALSPPLAEEPEALSRGGGDVDVSSVRTATPPPPPSYPIYSPRYLEEALTVLQEKDPEASPPGGSGGAGGWNETRHRTPEDRAFQMDRMLPHDRALLLESLRPAERAAVLEAILHRKSDGAAHVHVREDLFGLGSSPGDRSRAVSSWAVESLYGRHEESRVHDDAFLSARAEKTLLLEREMSRLEGMATERVRAMRESSREARERPAKRTQPSNPEGLRLLQGCGSGRAVVAPSSPAGAACIEGNLAMAGAREGILDLDLPHGASRRGGPRDVGFEWSDLNHDGVVDREEWNAAAASSVPSPASSPYQQGGMPSPASSPFQKGGMLSTLVGNGMAGESMAHRRHISNQHRSPKGSDEYESILQAAASSLVAELNEAASIARRHVMTRYELSLKSMPEGEAKLLQIQAFQLLQLRAEYKAAEDEAGTTLLASEHQLKQMSWMRDGTEKVLRMKNLHRLQLKSAAKRNEAIALQQLYDRCRLDVDAGDDATEAEERIMEASLLEDIVAAEDSARADAEAVAMDDVDQMPEGPEKLLRGQALAIALLQLQARSAEKRAAMRMLQSSTASELASTVMEQLHVIDDQIERMTEGRMVAPIPTKQREEEGDQQRNEAAAREEGSDGSTIDIELGRDLGFSPSISRSSSPEHPEAESPPTDEEEEEEEADAGTQVLPQGEDAGGENGPVERALRKGRAARRSLSPSESLNGYYQPYHRHHGNAPCQQEEVEDPLGVSEEVALLQGMTADARATRAKLHSLQGFGKEPMQGNRNRHHRDSDRRGDTGGWAESNAHRERRHLQHQQQAKSRKHPTVLHGKLEAFSAEEAAAGSNMRSRGRSQGPEPAIHSPTKASRRAQIYQQMLAQRAQVS